jgi:hypothetical protein
MLYFGNKTLEYHVAFLTDHLATKLQQEDERKLPNSYSYAIAANNELLNPQ